MLWCCFTDAPHARAVRAEALAAALQSLDNAPEHNIAFLRARADAYWSYCDADWAWQRVNLAFDQADDLMECDVADDLKECAGSVVRYYRTRERSHRAERRVDREWARVRAHWSRRRPPSLPARPRARGHRSRAARRLTGTSASRGDPPEQGDDEDSDSWLSLRPTGAGR